MIMGFNEYRLLNVGTRNCSKLLASIVVSEGKLFSTCVNIELL